ncbi:hypothetical protein GOB57_20960 [Sinorhizobium meliloti]|nr:hypothetical protein [Sinorhizobium meliloti]
MSALSKFLDRHGLDNDFRAKAGLFAAATVVAAATLFAPLHARAGQSFIPDRDSPIGGAGMAQRMAMIADRTTDRLEDMKTIRKALHTHPDLGRGRDGELAADLLIEINNRLYQDTPYPELARFDMTRLGLPDTLEEGASMEYAASAINFQKKTLLEATNALAVLVDAYNRGSRRDAQRAIESLDEVMATYGYSEKQVLQSIRSSLDEMRSEEGWIRGKQVDF